ncbi:unnamed protein product [Rhodiola kirilowii]
MHQSKRCLGSWRSQGAAPNISDAYTINGGQPGDLYPCSARGRWSSMAYGKTYVRIVNAVMNEIHFLGIADHPMTDSGGGRRQLHQTIHKQLCCVIGPGQTIDVLVHANQDPGQRYYLAASPYNSNPLIGFDNTTTTAIFH